MGLSSMDRCTEMEAILCKNRPGRVVAGFITLIFCLFSPAFGSKSGIEPRFGPIGLTENPWFTQ